MELRTAALLVALAGAGCDDDVKTPPRLEDMAVAAADAGPVDMEPSDASRDQVCDMIGKCLEGIPEGVTPIDVEEPVDIDPRDPRQGPPEPRSQEDPSFNDDPDYGPDSSHIE
jgi:hypothetical protein